MIQRILERLSQQPRALAAALVMDDGVSVGQESTGVDDGVQSAAVEGLPGSSPDALAAFSAAWAGEVCRAVAGLVGERPGTLSLRGSRGTLLMRRAHTACSTYGARNAAAALAVGLAAWLLRLKLRQVSQVKSGKP